MSYLYRVFLVVAVFLLLAACATDAPASFPTTSPTATVSPSPMPTAVPATIPTPTPKPTVLRVAYFGGGHIMLWTEGKGARQLADAQNVGQVRISDDGQMIAYLDRNSRGIYEISSINADGTSQRVLAGQDYLRNIRSTERIVSLDFAPASHTLYFVTDQYDLHRINADSGKPTAVFGAGQGGAVNFSPDGRWVTLYHPRELLLARSDGSAARVVYEWLPDDGIGTMGPEIIWSPDSAGFRMVAPTFPQGSPNSMTVWYFPVNGNPVKQMSYTGPHGANLSPDGRAVVYLYHQHDPVDVHIVTADGKDTTFGSYASQSYVNLNFIGWAPDSKHFLLNLGNDGRLVAPYLCAVGEQPAKLTDTDDALPVVWVDAQRVLFASRGSALRLQRVGAPSVLLDANASSYFDYAYINP